MPGRTARWLCPEGGPQPSKRPSSQSPQAGDGGRVPQIAHQTQGEQDENKIAVYLRQVHVHLISVKVGVVGRADALVESEGAVGHNPGTVGHD
eukprot:scaffold4633_cov114-Isochrysis_galbana.AAC.8